MAFHQIMSPLLGAPSINILLHAIINQYLSDSYCLTFVLEQPIYFNVGIAFVHITPNNGTDLTDQLLEVSEKGCSDFVVFMSDPQKFMVAFDQVNHIGNTRRSDRKIVILPYSMEHNYVNISLDLLSLKESTFVANMLLILSRKAETNCELYDLVTHEFISLERDQPLYLDQWDSCTQKFVNNVNLFPHDLVNLNGRILRVACFTYKPYSLLDLDTAVVESQRDGIEVRIVDEFCIWLNCTVEIVPEEKDEWGLVFENGTGNGVIGAVVMDRADLGISALYLWYEEYLLMDFSATGIRSAVTCIAPSPRLLASWEMPLTPFSWGMWFAVIIAWLFASIGLIIAKGSTDKVFLTVFGIMLTQTLFRLDRLHKKNISQGKTKGGRVAMYMRDSVNGIPIVAKRNQRYMCDESQKDETAWRIRSITGWLLGASLILVSAYGAGLACTFTVPKYEASIDTIQDLVERKMEWGATHDAWVFSLLQSKEPFVKKLVRQFKIYSAEELKRRSFTRDMALSIEKLPAGSFAIGDYVTKEALLDLTLMLEDFYFEHCTVMMRKSSIYTEKLSTFIGRMHESGLMLAWETQVTLKYLNFGVQQEVRLSRVKSDGGFITALALRHVVGVYILYLFGVVLATLIFVGEYCIGKRRARRNELRAEHND